MRINMQKKLPINKEKMQGDVDRQYEFWRHYTITLNSILDEIRMTLNRHADKLDELEAKIEGP